MLFSKGGRDAAAATELREPQQAVLSFTETHKSLLHAVWISAGWREPTTPSDSESIPDLPHEDSGQINTAASDGSTSPVDFHEAEKSVEEDLSQQLLSRCIQQYKKVPNQSGQQDHLDSENTIKF